MSMLLARSAWATPDLKFDVVTFCCQCAPDNTLCQPQFDHLNFPTPNGHYIAMGSDAHRLELATNGNALAVYYNTFNDGWPTNSDAEQAARIDQYVAKGFTSTGPKPAWVVLNEISSSMWQNDGAYRTWVHEVVHELKTSYGYNVILYSPFANPGANNFDWQAVSTDAYIGVENYLSGEDVQGHGFSVNWCKGQYQSSINSYTNLGVSRDRLMLGEHFAQTLSGTFYGRSGVSSNDWDQAIIVRNQAAQSAAFAGFLSYAWAKNAMLVPDEELIHYEDTYRTNQLPVDNGITAPFILVQPQGQTAAPGATVGFLVFRAGIAPLAYQWRLEGTNLPGATASVLTLTNVQSANSGNYSVVLSNAAGVTVSSNALLLVQTPPPQAFEPFAPALTTYTPGANLIGQTNAVGQRWTQAGPDSGNQPTIAASSLSVPGLEPSTGNSTHFGGNGTSARFNIGTNVNSGTYYFSFAFKLTDITGLSSSGIFWAGFNNSSGTQKTTPTTVDTRIHAKLAPGGYYLGLDKSSGSPASFVFLTNVFSLNETVFVVGSYQFNSLSSTDDVARLWINPAPSTFGLASPGPASLTNSAGTDIDGIASFVFFNRNTAEPAGIIADELRVGSSWASVTPSAPAPARPILMITRVDSQIVLSWSTNATGFTLETNDSLSNPDLWSSLGAPVYILADQFVVTNGATGAGLFYRLHWP